MARTKPRVMAVYLPSGLHIGVIVSRPQTRARPAVAIHQREGAVAAPNQPQTSKGSNRENSHFLQFGQRDEELTATRPMDRATKAKERAAKELAIDGTNLLDLRKANPSMFEPGKVEERRMRPSKSRASAGDREDEVNGVAPSSKPAVSARKDSKVGVTQDAFHTNIDQQGVINGPTGFTDPLTPTATPNSTLPITDEAIQPTSADETRITTTTEAESPQTKMKRRFDKELATDGTALLKHSHLTDANSLVTEYYDGKRWYQVVESERPAWATDERVVDRRSKHINDGDETEKSLYGRPIKKQRMA